MLRHPAIGWDDRRGYRAVAILSLGAIGFTGILSLSPDPLFQPFFKNIPPLLAVSIIGVLGVVSLGFLSSRGWFEIHSRQESLRGVAWASAFATMFAVVIILADLFVIFPYRHVPPPQSLLFYPTIAYVAEIVFHILPLSILLALLGPLFKGRDSTKLLWLCIVLTSCPEPLFQLSWRASEATLGPADVYVGLHVLAFNLLQLSVFKRYDFVSMFVFRLVYYLYWHVMWGSVRQYMPS
ncbi:MAG: hypothetical protein U0236_05200 [Nitrospira sp.]